jgi:stress-induced morphogen
LQSEVIEDSAGHDSRAGGSIYGSEGGVVSSSIGQSVLFDCLLCSRSFKSKQSLHEHNISKHTPGGFLTSKSELGAESTRSVLSSSGIAYVSDNMIIDSSDNSNGDPTNSQQAITQPPILKCSICDLGFATEAMLERHLTFGWRPVSDNSGAATNHSDSTTSEGHGDDQSLTCHICSKTFKELRARNQHMNYCILKTK